DHRGKVVWVSQQLDPDRKGAVRDVALRRHRALYGVMVLVTTAVAVLAGLLAVLALSIAWPTYPVSVAAILFFAVVVIVGGGGLRQYQQRLFLRRFARRLLGAGVCICCAYDLKAVPA